MTKPSLSSSKPRVSSNIPELRATRERIRARSRQLRIADDVCAWGEDNYNIEETGEPIELAPHQKAVLRYCLKRGPDGRLPFTTIIWSQPKKSGKTAIAGMVARWAAETWGRYGEILCVGNDAEQARERAFKAIKTSIELERTYHPGRQELPGRWRVLTKEATCLTTGTKIRAIATDYRGEAGANPILIVWTELWGFTQEASLRFWAEMTPSPTRLNSITWVETYAGYEGESELLWQLYDSTVNRGRQLTAGELGAPGAFEETPHEDDLVPCYVNEPGRIFTYWDQGAVARRMSWQRGQRGDEYYAGEAAKQTPKQMERLHNNQWVSAESAFIPIEWWDACKNPLPLQPGERTPLIVGLDAAVTGDCFGLVVMSRDPNDSTNSVAVRGVRKWDPPPGGAIDYAGPEAACRELARDYNVAQFAYDPYQLHDFATRLMKEGVGWFRPFTQGQDRLMSDKGLYDLIVHRRIRHDGNAELREHMTNANAKQAANEDSKLRIVKKSDSRKIDLVICVSMAAAECLRLNL